MRGDALPREEGAGGGPAAWDDALAAAALIAVDPRGLSGAVVRAAPGPARDAWLAALAALGGGPALRLPHRADDAALFGGIDLAATLAAGRPVRAAGLLAAAGDRVLVLPTAERAGRGLAARLGGFLDAAGGCLVALDEGRGEEAAPEGLADRLAFRPDLGEARAADLARPLPWSAAAVRAARARLGRVDVPAEAAGRLVAVAAALGIGSLRAPLLALRAARAAAALEGDASVGPRAEALAARLVLGPRAERMPVPPEAGEEDEEDRPAPDAATEADAPDQKAEADAPDQKAEADAPDREADPDAPDQEADAPDREAEGGLPAELAVEAARAAIPAGLLARLLAGAGPGRRRRMAGAGGDEWSLRRGRPAGVLARRPGGAARIALVDTLRAAAPWQRLRGREGPQDRVAVRAGDLRVKRYRRRAERLAVFVVDASGSTALARLGEAKGAVELMLGEAYAGRDAVALVAFRGTGAETLLPPTRALAAARRRLSGLPGGGGTPLAAGLGEALAVVSAARARGMIPTLAILTDGRANVCRDGTPGRPRAEAEALEAARALGAAGCAALLVDTGSRPSEAARALARSMGAAYLPLPRADARALAGAVRAAAGAAAGAAVGAAAGA